MSAETTGPGDLFPPGGKKTPAGGAIPRSLLLVAYFYPPSRDTGARRPESMARHLRALGHQVTVLTTRAYGEGSDDEEHVVRTADLQLLRARLRGKDRVDALYDADTYTGRPHPLSRVLVPEPLVAAWAPFARRAAIRLHRQRPFDCVITSSPPESAHTVGRALHREGVPWVADVRDGWTFESLRPPFPTAAQRRRDERLERRWLGEADAVVCVSPPVAEDLRSRKIATPVVVPNGWDPESAPAAEPAGTGILDRERVSLVYTGRFGGYGRDPGPLVAALANLATTDADTAAKLELVVAGPLTAEEARLFETDVTPARIVHAGSLPRERALALQREADALLLLASPARTQLANFKLFEYLAAGRPIVALAAGTEAGRIVEEAGGTSVRADDPAAITTELRRLAAGELLTPSPAARDAHSYPALATRMAAAVEGAIARASPDS